MSETGLLLAEIQALKRRIQALETVTEHPGFSASDVARLSQNNTFAGIQTIPNTGLHILDTDGSHDLIIAPGSNLSADTTLTLVMTANRTLTLTGNATLDQDASTAGSPTFGPTTVSANTQTTPLVLRLMDTDTAVAAAQVGGTIEFYTSDISGPGIGSSIRSQYVNTAATSNLILSTGGPSGLLDIVTLQYDGRVGINSPTPEGTLATRQSSTTAAIPTVYLQQADLSEEFFRFDTTVSAGNPINTTALGAYYGRVRVYVVGVGVKWMALYDS